MPLSEEEQRILQEIERNFYENDPNFVEAVSTTALYRHGVRNCKMAAAGFVVGLVILIATYASLPIAAFVGFATMLVSAVFFVRNARRIGSAGLRDVADSHKARKVNSSLGDVRKRFRRPPSD